MPSCLDGEAAEDLTVAEVAGLLGASIQTCQRWAQSGRFPGARLVKRGRGWRYSIPSTALATLQRPTRGWRPTAPDGDQFWALVCAVVKLAVKDARRRQDPGWKELEGLDLPAGMTLQEDARQFLEAIGIDA